MERWYRSTGARSLAHYCDVLRGERARPSSAGVVGGVGESVEAVTQVERSRSFRDSAQRVQQTSAALDELLECAEVSEGYVFVAREGGYVCRAKVGSRLVSKQLAEWVSQRLAFAQSTTTLNDDDAGLAAKNQIVVRGRTYSLRVISIAGPTGERVLGGVGAGGRARVAPGRVVARAGRAHSGEQQHWRVGRLSVSTEAPRGLRSG